MHFWYILDDQGEPVPSKGDEAWYKFMMAGELRIIARTTVGDAEVRTDFVGWNQAVGSAFTGGPPLLWETMVFCGGLPGDYERYSSRDDAVEGHARMVAKLQSANPKDANAKPEGCS